ncbi:MAG: hypothetical protein H7099_12530, partial [Gemmatimonadaceae bacterium]|nr:hypothetical protein [Gemmatimonadaceae bacterium]
SRQRPRALALATARFLPAGMLEATTIQPVPMDRWWMALRLLILALLALGVAQPIVTGSRVPSRTVLLLDRTLPAEVQRAATASLLPTDAVIAFDTSTVVTSPTAVATDVAGTASLSAGLARLVRVRDSLADGATQLHVAIASTFAAQMFDPGSESLRALIPDSIAPLPITLPADTLRPRGAIVVRADVDDPIAATAILLGDGVAPANTIIERGATVSSADSAAARDGATVFWWPATSTPRTARLEAVTVGSRTWIAPMGRDSTSAPASAHAIGWWADGHVAVTSESVGRGCVLTMHAALPDAGDQTLSLSAQAWLARLLASCEKPRVMQHAPPAWLVAPTRSVAPIDVRATQLSTLAPWLVGAGLLLAALELLLRLRTARA